MNTKISADELIEIVKKSDLDSTIKEILIRDIRSEGVSEFLIEQVMAYCDNAIALIQKRMKDEKPS